MGICGEGVELADEISDGEDVGDEDQELTDVDGRTGTLRAGCFMGDAESTCWRFSEMPLTKCYIISKEANF